MEKACYASASADSRAQPPHDAAKKRSLFLIAKALLTEVDDFVADNGCKRYSNPMQTRPYYDIMANSHHGPGMIELCAS